jgi:hypothetical protein
LCPTAGTGTFKHGIIAHVRRNAYACVGNLDFRLVAVCSRGKPDFAARTQFAVLISSYGSDGRNGALLLSDLQRGPPGWIFELQLRAKEIVNAPSRRFMVQLFDHKGTMSGEHDDSSQGRRSCTFRNLLVQAAQQE